MKDHLRRLVRDVDPLAGRNIAREYLQARLLEAMQRAGAFAHVACRGGAAVRFLYDLPRYSEDLDFALEGDRTGYDLRGWLEAVRRQFRREGYAVRAAVRDGGAVHAARLRFPGVLYEIGLSPHRDQALAVKIEVDTDPPDGAVARTRLVRRHVSLRLWHHDRASLLAGKIHAVLGRPFAKGRDVYDLAWYLSDPRWPAPNLRLLSAALDRGAESTGDEPPSPASAWREAVARRLSASSWDQLSADVRPFLEGRERLPSRAEVLGLTHTLRLAGRRFGAR